MPNLNPQGMKLKKPCKHLISTTSVHTCFNKMTLPTLRRSIIDVQQKLTFKRKALSQ